MNSSEALNQASCPSAALLQVKGLSVSYGSNLAVDGAHFAVNKGEIVSLIGSNGAGKTTALTALSGLLPLSAGSILFNGAEITKLSPEQRVNLGIAHVPERRRVFPGMSVKENLILGAYIRNDTCGIASDMSAVIALFPILGKRLSQAAGTLSGGEQQMLAIARGLMSRPSLLIMDEPTMGLAPQMIDVIIEKIQLIRDQGATILLVEQNAVEAIQLSSHVYVMRMGKIVHHEHGRNITTEDIKSFYLGK